MNKEEMQLIDRGYREGYSQAFGDAIKMSIKLITEASDSRILPPDKRYLLADLKLRAKRILQEKKLIPYEYDVITGKAEPVRLPWEE